MEFHERGVEEGLGQRYLCFNQTILCLHPVAEAVNAP